MGVLGSSFDNVSPFADLTPFDTTLNLLGLAPGVDNYVVTDLKLWDLGNYEVITQGGHTFVVGDAVRKSVSGSTYALAQADSATNSDAVGIVVAVGSGGHAGKFAVQFCGVVQIGAVVGGRYTGNLTIGSTYYLSASTAGLATTTAPGQGAINRPLFIAISATRAILLSQEAARKAIEPTIQFNQASPVLMVGDAVRKSGANYVVAQADSLTNGSVAGIITAKTGDDYTLTVAGYADIGNVAGGRYSAAFADNAVRYLSRTTAGLAESGYPATGELVCPLFVPVSSTRVVLVGLGTFDQGPREFYDFTQASPSFLVGDAVRRTATDWVAADSASKAAAFVTGLIIAKSGNNYRVATGGLVKIGNVAGGRYTGSLTPGEVRYLAASGATTSTAPAADTVDKPVFVPITADLAVICPESPKLVPATQAISQVVPMPASGALYEYSHGRGVTPNFVRVVLVRKNSTFNWAPAGVTGLTIPIGFEIDITSVVSANRGAENERFWQICRFGADSSKVSVSLYYPQGFAWFTNSFLKNGSTNDAYYGNLGVAADYDLKVYLGWL